MPRLLPPFALILCCLVGLALLFAQPDAAFGQLPKRPNPENVFKFADRDKDGKLSLEEFRRVVVNLPRFKGQADKIDQLFGYLDADSDGKLSLEEFKKLNSLGAGKGKGKSEDKESTPVVPAKSSGFNDNPTSEQLNFFEKKIRPILVDECQKCHSAAGDKQRGGLALDTREGLRKGGESGAALVPGQPARSLLIKAMHHKDETLQMPPKKKLSAEVLADFESWVKQGAPDPRTGSKSAAKQEIDIEKGRTFWSFQPPRKTPPPQVKNAAWPRNDIDRFLLAKLESKGLAPVGDADRHTLLRRIYLDLIGLPPTPEEITAFVADSSSEALAKVVDRLLASSHFGERWGRHWLDVARYAETSGKQVNLNYPYAWRYRDWVIKALNDDKPYDRFVMEQLAGDLMPANSETDRAWQQVATGFLALGPKAHNERNRLQFELDVVDEQIDATTQAFLGLTVACARCHDHKFDPIPQRDYYAMAGIFRSTETCYGTVRLIQNAHPSPLIELPASAGLPAGKPKMTDSERQRIEKQLASQKEKRSELLKKGNLFGSREGILLSFQMAFSQAQLDAHNADGSAKVRTMGVRERNRTINSPLFVRGETSKPGEIVPRGFVQVLSKESPRITRGSGRLELARSFASRDNPLTARVQVNRVWLHLFGRGLVPTPDNFGVAGLPPSHPELLDHLAIWFMDSGWSVKKLIREIVLSRAYALASTHDERASEIDPDNTLVWRMSKRRLEAEVLRDAMLAVSGNLETTPPVASPLLRIGEGLPGPLQRGQGIDARMPTRSVYLPILRNGTLESLTLFDFGDPSIVVAERATTSVPAQGLYLLNNPFVVRSADAAAGRLLQGKQSDEERIQLAYLRFFGRPAEPREVKAAQEYVASQSKGLMGRRTAWASLCQALMASAEFLYRN